MKVFLVRHGQSQWQLEPSQDWDTALTDLGRRQADLLAAWCAEHELLDAHSRLEFDTLFSSPLVRARQTADKLAAAVGLPAAVRPDLAEADFHVVSQLPVRKAPFDGEWEGAPTERYQVFRDRVRNALAELTRQAETTGRPVLAVTHGGVIKTVLRIVAESDAFCLKLYNCGITAIEWKDGRWRVAHVNLWDHLPPRMRTT